MVFLTAETDRGGGAERAKINLAYRYIIRVGVHDVTDVSRDSCIISQR